MSDPRRQAPGRNGEGIRRRDFLALGTAAAAAATAAATWPTSAFADLSPLGVNLESGPPLSVGYIAGSGTWVQELDLPWDAPGFDPAEFEVAIEPAEALTVGSQLAGAEIELSVHGLFPRLPRPRAATWKSCYLFASVPAPPELIFGPDPVPFLAWSARMDPQPRQAAKVRPKLPTGVDGALRLGLEMRAANTQGLGKPAGSGRPVPAPSILTRTTNFTVDDIPGRPKLQEGVYLLAFSKGLWERSWSGTLAELREVDGLDSVAIGIRLLE